MISTIAHSTRQFGRRYRQLRSLWSSQGLRGISSRLRTAAAEYILPKEITLPVERGDILAADLLHPHQATVPKLIPGERLVLNWVIIPAGPRSGGHSTIFRIIRYLEANGNLNRVYFYNVYGADHEFYESIVRSSYGFDGFVGRVEDGMMDAHGVIASAWATAYPVFNSRCAGKRFYFVQDYEPSFHPVGAISLFAENTYRMGFHAITAGRWMAKRLRQEFGMKADSFDFGCDTSSYGLLPNAKRSGVVFYARPEAARRGYELGLMAMEIFAERNRDVRVHFYGETLGRIPARFINHGRISPERLNQIYNECYGGLSLSLTNVSLVPHEMLAAGCIPVVNDAEHNRMVLDNLHVRYASPDPHALATELEAVISSADTDERAHLAAASVRAASWDDAGATVDAIIRDALTSEQSEWEQGLKCEVSAGINGT